MHMSVLTTIIKKAWRLRHEDPARLALQLQKQSELTPDERQNLIRQIKGRQAVAKKLPRWAENPDVVFPPAQNLEQSSSEITAEYKATLLVDDPLNNEISPEEHHPTKNGTQPNSIQSHGSPSKTQDRANNTQDQSIANQNRIIKTLVDLTGGFGVDSAFFAQYFSHVIHVEPDSELQVIVEYNCRQLGIPNITFQNTTAEKWLHQSEQNLAGTLPGTLRDTMVKAPFGITPEAPLETTPATTLDTTPETIFGTFFDTLYIDPSRRPGTGPQRQTRVSTLEDSLPNVLALLPLMCKLAHRILIKASPMISIPETIRQLNGVLGTGQCGILHEVHIVSVQNECKEVLFRVDGRGISGRTDGLGHTDGADRSDRVADVSSIPQEPRIVAVNLEARDATDDTPRGSEFVFWPREEAAAGPSVVYADPGILFEWGSAVQDKEEGSNVDGKVDGDVDGKAGEYYLFEPNASIMKSGAFNLVATRYGLQKLAPNTHLYVWLSKESWSGTMSESCTMGRSGAAYRSDAVERSGAVDGYVEGMNSEAEKPAQFGGLPGRVMRICRVMPYQQETMRMVLRDELGIDRAQIATRNFPESEEKVRKKTGLKQAGLSAGYNPGQDTRDKQNGRVHRLVTCRLADDRLVAIVGVLEE